ncbi:hypothetical protein [Occallatibacter riparius]|uniref:Uncharacterized protein n=1 Tax=Occallatibacter riparius TaxID=1002689 RepID=A0A9J7BP29_9BACT|nr:hypothetical protein [Occallatibacter riparius]UWZ82678.1 hypothetical protein MOP44_19160 [Occallatibacter riparius]
MRINQTLLAGLCLLATAAMYGQTASVQRNPKQNKLGPMSFSYDAQHDQIVPNGIQLNAHAANINITPTTGRIEVTVNINPQSHFDKGTKFHCSLLVIGGEIDTTDGVVGGGIETTNSVAKKDTCTLTIPYSWTIPPDSGASSGMILAVGVSAVQGGEPGHSGHDAEWNGNGGGMVVRTSLQVGGVEALPPNGSTTSITFEIVL